MSDRGRRLGDSPSRKSDSSKKSSSSSYISSEDSHSSRKGPPTHPPIVHPEPAPPGYEYIKDRLVRKKGEKWLPPPKPEKKILSEHVKEAEKLSGKTETRDGKPYNPRDEYVKKHTPVSLAPAANSLLLQTPSTFLRRHFKCHADLLLGPEIQFP